ncbi:MAG TPA: branched-chain amino acid ABC transporter ATP-binding protein/permease [Acidimicrobiales bacterium]|nr:branched-chain amino acid ABC transporter ATP-binding protein/permease [Acidimicrobiales bacterium]
MSPAHARTPEQTRALAGRIFRYAVLALLVAWPWYGNTFVLLGDANVALVYAIVASSLVLLTGWVGQISLAQASFVGIGAFATAVVARNLHLGFPLSLVLAAAASAAAATLLGIVALRVRGLLLAVATLIFAWMCDTYLFLSPWLTGGGGTVSVEPVAVGTEGAFPYFDFTNRRTFYYVALGIAAMVFFALSNLRDSKTGRAFFALSGSEVAAASVGIDVTRYKLLAFALAGFVAGMAGNLTAVYQGALNPAQFRFTVSFFYLAIPVVGGLKSLKGTVAASLLFGALADLFFRVEALNGYLEIVSAGLLMAVLLAYPGGLAAFPATLQGWLDDMSPTIDRVRRSAPVSAVLLAMQGAGEAVARVAPAPRSGAATRLRSLFPGRRGASPPAGLLPLEALGLGAVPAPVASTNGHSAPVELPLVLSTNDRSSARPAGAREDRRPVLQAEGITVQFGSLTAVDGVSVSVREGEIVGLIGPNGAGKTTLFNAIAGLNRPTAGTVKIFDEDATGLPVHARARLGVGRTFQAIQLLRDLTVFENLLVATHLQNETGFLAHITVTRAALLAEDRSRALVRRVIDLLGLEEVAHRRVGDLPFGITRMVEVARALVTRSPLIMLDEPASGLDNRETKRLADFLLGLRAQFGVSILLIEHDVEMVMSVCDFVHVIDQGKLIAAGPTDDVRRDPRVVAAYLGQPMEAPTASARRKEAVSS